MQRPIEQLLPQANYSVYQLVRLASIRALELSDGKKCLVDNLNTDKVTTLALEEIAQRKVESLAASEILPPPVHDEVVSDVAAEAVAEVAE